MPDDGIDAMHAIRGDFPDARITNDRTQAAMIGVKRGIHPTLATRNCVKKSPFGFAAGFGTS